MAVTAVRLALAAHDTRDSERLEHIEQAFFEAGALSVVLTDQRDDPVLEPKPGEVRLWPATQLEALFQAGDGGAHDLLGDGLQSPVFISLAENIGYPLTAFTLEPVADRAWEREWLRDYQPLRFGRRLWVCPTHQGVTESEAVILTLDPGLAFGTGTHPTTRLCLEFIEALPAPPAVVVDYGCGSGILALAALQLGSHDAWAYDIDPQALEATLENARRNGLASRVHPFAEAEALNQRAREAGGVPLVLANILAAPLIELADPLAHLLAPGGSLVLAGLLDEQASDVIAAYQPWLTLTPWRQLDGWTCLSGTRP